MTDVCVAVVRFELDGEEVKDLLIGGVKRAGNGKVGKSHHPDEGGQRQSEKIRWRAKSHQYLDVQNLPKDLKKVFRLELMDVRLLVNPSEGTYRGRSILFCYYRKRAAAEGEIPPMVLEFLQKCYDDYYGKIDAVFRPWRGEIGVWIEQLLDLEAPPDNHRWQEWRLYCNPYFMMPLYIMKS
ncbi:MAG: hypothetical protein COT91_01900 [Candidatus Doudnabacteria bacterium CG10_big_fil_rev_8_21_14_0_10_41_10]|uniref:Uncharacterized protein n=1 Tax=Candidatus Doudnabacteria bacterium CG10_big_fil_rev_8_21_14_0_10_41_10 TaxID=1974551 RepID=A0A2H0VE14_9BACT|nr:MAG: hypothetical protein COT91_01900 [Candidatus Doudnabacteria bacterium CG10_big_fil_rev_8_21_14_0_10_41_10]